MTDLSDSLHIWLPGFLVMLGLVLCSGFFSASETAFFFLSRDQIRKFASGNRRERKIARLLEDPDRLLTAVLFWNLVINLSYFSIGVVVMQKLNRDGFTGIAACFGILNLIGMIVLGEVIPKSTAVVFRQQISSFAVWPLAACIRILDPVIPWLNSMARILRRTFWPHVNHEAHLQPEDLEQAIDASAATTTELLEIEQQVLHNILDMNELDVEEVMRPRTLLTTVGPCETIASIDDAIDNLQYLLLKEEGEDICHRAVALNRITEPTQQTFGELAEDVIFVPWCASLAYTLSELRTRFASVAVVVHEHGEMIGAVTYDDLLETIFVDSPSRTRRVLGREPLIEIGKNRFHAEGLVTLRYLFRQLRIPFDADDEDQTTLAGLFHDKLEKIPSVGDRIMEEGWIFTAIEVSQQGQVRALIEPKEYSLEVSQEGSP